MGTEKRSEVSLADILAARDVRVKKQRSLLAAFPGKPLVCLLVNMPGPVKRTESSDRVFDAGRAALLAALDSAGIPLLYGESNRAATGSEAYLIADTDAETLKRLACALENELPYGRLLDIDVHAPDGRQVSRTALSLPERGCMVCGRPGAFCASRRLHALPELLAAFDRLADSAREERV